VHTHPLADVIIAEHFCSVHAVTANMRPLVDRPERRDGWVIDQKDAVQRDTTTTAAEAAGLVGAGRFNASQCPLLSLSVN